MEYDKKNNNKKCHEHYISHTSSCSMCIHCLISPPCLLTKSFGLRQANKSLWTSTKSTDLDHPAHMQSIIWTFALHSYILYRQWFCWGTAKAPIRLRWCRVWSGPLAVPICPKTFFHGAAHLITPKIVIRQGQCAGWSGTLYFVCTFSHVTPHLYTRKSISSHFFAAFSFSPLAIRDYI